MKKSFSERKKMGADRGGRSFTRSNASKALGLAVNLLMVLIQLFTVWILWLTYKNTVIPTSQKELLSEQVAQLEMEKKERSRDIVAAKQEVRELGGELKAKHAEIGKLAIERSRLAREIKEASMHAQNAQSFAKSEQFLANKATKNLTAIQWSVYYQSASMIVDLPQLKFIRLTSQSALKSLDADDPAKEFHKYLQVLDDNWPNPKANANFVSNKLREDSSNFYPHWMALEFANYFQKNASSVECARPDFQKIGHDFDINYEDQVRPAKKKAEDENPTSSPFRQWNVKIALNNVAYTVSKNIASDLAKQASSCFSRFTAVGDVFFKAKNISQPNFPDSVQKEMKTDIQY